MSSPSELCKFTSPHILWGTPSLSSAHPSLIIIIISKATKERTHLRTQAKSQPCSRTEMLLGMRLVSAARQTRKSSHAVHQRSFLNHQLEASIRLQVWPLCSRTERNTANRENKPTRSRTSLDMSRGADKRKAQASPTLSSAAGKNYRVTQRLWVRLQLTSPLSIIQMSQAVRSNKCKMKEHHGGAKEGTERTTSFYIVPLLCGY